MPNKKHTYSAPTKPGIPSVPHSGADLDCRVDDWIRLSRFLILGSEKGTYYTQERVLTAASTEAVQRCIRVDGDRTVREIVAVSESERTPKKDPAIFALALASSSEVEATRRVALEALPRVCRTGRDLFHFAQFIDGMRGWGRGLRVAVGRWYSEKPVPEIAYQAVLYGQQDRWSHRDLLRLAHPKPDTDARRILYHWMSQGWERIGDAPHDQTDLQLIWAAEKAKVPGTTPKTIAELIRTYDLPREAVPTAVLNERIVWEALLERMSLTELIRNLATLTRVGVLESRTWQTYVSTQITDVRSLLSEKIQPMVVLAAMKAYGLGHGERGKHSWTPAPKILEALDSAFYRTFNTVSVARKRWLFALDVPNSLRSQTIARMPGVSPLIASIAIALVTMAIEQDVQIVACPNEWVPLTISPDQRLEDIEKLWGKVAFKGNDCAKLLFWAMNNRVPVDTFVVCTDRETGPEMMPVTLALREYRQKMGIPARLIVIDFLTNAFLTANPDDSGMLDVVGFDTATPQIIADFSRE